MQIRFCFDYFSLDNIWKIILKRGQKWILQKSVKADSDYLRGDLSNGDLRIVVVLLIFLAISFRVFILKEQSSCTYVKSKTVVRKFSARRIQICLSIFVLSILTSFQKAFPNIVGTKIDMVDLDSPRQILFFQGLRFFSSPLICMGMNFVNISGSEAVMRTLDNIVFAHTGDILVQIHRFLREYWKPIIKN